jgi:hypothetical protein
VDGLEERTVAVESGDRVIVFSSWTDMTAPAFERLKNITKHYTNNISGSFLPHLWRQSVQRVSAIRLIKKTTFEFNVG